jgi:hypothetical protein
VLVGVAVLVIAGWADVTRLLQMSAYSADTTVPVYEGEADCGSSFCASWDAAPNLAYYFAEAGILYSPIHPETIPLPTGLWELERQRLCRVMAKPPRSGFRMVEEATQDQLSVGKILCCRLSQLYSYDIRITTPKEDSLSRRPPPRTPPPPEELAKNDEHYLPEHLRPKPHPECADCANLQQPGSKCPSYGAPYEEVL